MREIADSVGAYLMADIAHISGLVATKQCNSPFPYCDVVTSTTHKSLRGPRSGIMFCKKELEESINSAVFPALQGGPHNHQIAALAVALGEASTEEFKQYIKQVKLNAKTLGEAMINLGYSIVTGGTDNHLVLWDARSTGLSGAKIEKLLERLDISVNKNTVVGDISAVSPGGIRLGTPAMTTRGMKEEDMRKIAQLIDTAVKVGEKGKDKKKVVDFIEFIERNYESELNAIREDVIRLASSFSMPGIEPR
jgi:glycine hydroxymethyltransferase